MSHDKRRHRRLRHETLTTSAKWTGVRDPRATTRFSLDDRVTWDRDTHVILGTIVAFVDDTTVKVRLENGSETIWPTFSPRMRRVQSPDFDEVDPGGDTSMTSTDGPSVRRELADDPYYASVIVDTEASKRDAIRRTIPDFPEYESTYPGILAEADEDKTRGGK